MAKLSLARAHRHGRVPLREFDRVEAFGDRALHILDGDVLADADEALPRSPARERVGRLAPSSPVTRPTASTPAGRSPGAKTPRVGVVPDAGAGLGEQRVGGLAPGGSDEHVAVDGPVDLDGRQPAAPVRGLELGGRRPRRSTPSRRPAGARGSRRPESALVDREDDRAQARPDRPQSSIRRARFGSSRREVVAVEEQRLLDRAGGDDDCSARMR